MYYKKRVRKTLVVLRLCTKWEVCDWLRAPAAAQSFFQGSPLLLCKCRQAADPQCQEAGTNKAMAAVLWEQLGRCLQRKI